MNRDKEMSELLDILEKTDVNSEAWSRINVRVNLLYLQASMFGDKISNELIWRTYKISVKKIGFIQTVQAILAGIKIAVDDLRK